MAEFKRAAPLFKGNTPAGIARFPYLTAPDDKPINGKPQDPKYKTGLLLNPDDEGHATFLAHMETVYEKAVVAAKEEMAAKLEAEGDKAKAAKLKKDFSAFTASDTWKKPVFDSEGNETGEVEVQIRCAAQYKDKQGNVKKIKLPLFDAKGKPLAGIDLWGGSKIKVNFEARHYLNAAAKNYGMSLRLLAVQVLELRNGTAKDAAGFGFGEEEGYEAPTEEAFPKDGESAPGAGDEF